MFRIHNNRKRWRTRWPWRWLFPLKIDERFCRECGLPYHEGPLPETVARYRDGQVGAHVFPAGSFRRDEYVVQFGRWKGGFQKQRFSEFIPESELDAVIEVAKVAYANYLERQRARDRRARR